MSIYDKLEQRYPIELLAEYICSNEVQIKPAAFQKVFHTISSNKFYQKKLLKLLIDNPSLLESENNISAKKNEEIEELQEWAQEEYMSFLNVQFDPDLVDVITYIIPQPPASSSSSSSSSVCVSDSCVKIKIREVPYKISGNNTTGFRTWEAALYLLFFLYGETSPISELVQKANIKHINDNAKAMFSKPLRVLELGSGTGICGLALYKFPVGLQIEEVTLSDGSQDIVENIIPHNYELNKEAREESRSVTKLSIKQILWGKDDFIPELKHSYDLIIGADVTYDARVIPLLVESIDYYLGFEKDSMCLISATIRNESTIKTFEDSFVTSWGESDDAGNESRVGNLKVEKISDTKTIDKKLLMRFQKEVWFKDMIAPISVYKITRTL
ncbi:hypothetical protein ACO0QE_001800 [Hanseniaspora vineae]